MKQNRLVGFLGFATLCLALSGCVPTALAPFYLEGDTFFDPALVGTWETKTEFIDGPSTRYKFEPDGGHGYRLTTSIKEPNLPFHVTVPLAPPTRPPVQSAGVRSAHLFRLGDHTFLDLCSAPGCSPTELAPRVRTHMVLLVLGVHPTLRVKRFDFPWLIQHLKKNPESLRHIWATGNDDRGQLVLTAETKELQSFILKHLDTEGAWVTELEMVRLEAPDAK